MNGKVFPCLIRRAERTTKFEKVKMEENDPATTGKPPSTLLIATKRAKKMTDV